MLIACQRFKLRTAFGFQMIAWNEDPDLLPFQTRRVALRAAHDLELSHNQLLFGALVPVGHGASYPPASWAGILSKKGPSYVLGTI
jgi:hypothetical protein